MPCIDDAGVNECTVFVIQYIVNLITKFIAVVTVKNNLQLIYFGKRVPINLQLLLLYTSMLNSFRVATICEINVCKSF